MTICFMRASCKAIRNNIYIIRKNLKGNEYTTSKLIPIAQQERKGRKEQKNLKTKVISQISVQTGSACLL